MLEGIERLGAANDWITIVLMLVLILIAVIQYNFTERFYKLFSLVYSEKYYTDYIKNKPLNLNVFHTLFLFVINFNISLLIFWLLKTFKSDAHAYDLVFYFKILALTFTYFAIRYFIGLILGAIFSLEASQNYFTFLKISNLSLLSILLFPLLILTSYTYGAFHKFLITFTAILILSMGLFRYFVMVKNEKLGFNNLFYLFLYLCALELAPFIVVYKLFVD